ncbi:MAG: hypothetical protein K0S14_1285 [Thermomicrobiales bacterium]|nr:hypothetical protein [Thermomicrobiales bacterium]MCD6057822.1 hypothetical protein [Thermomicrobiales bacterium]
MDKPVDDDALRGRGNIAPKDHLTRRQASRLTSALGIAFAVLFLAGLVMVARIPGVHATDADLATFYASGERRLIVFSGLYVLPLAAVAFLWFVAALRQWVEMSSRTIDHLLVTVQMLSGVAFITLAFASAGAITIVANGIELASLPVDPTVARQFPLYSRTLLIIFGMRMAALFVTTTAKLGHEAQLFPRWFVFGSYGVAAALFLAATLNVWLVVVFPLWVLVLNGIIWFHGRTIVHEPAASTSPL